VHGTALTLKKLRAKFGKRAGADTLTLVATAAMGTGQTFDPSTGELSVSVGVPNGPRMAVIEWTFPAGAVTGRNGRFRVKGGKGTPNGLRALTLVVKHGKATLKLAAHTDLAVLRAGVQSDWTLAIEVGADVAGVTRPFKTNRKGTLVKGP
jgi:hypothetical protein